MRDLEPPGSYSRNQRSGSSTGKRRSFPRRTTRSPGWTWRLKELMEMKAEAAILQPQRPAT